MSSSDVNTRNHTMHGLSCMTLSWARQHINHCDMTCSSDPLTQLSNLVSVRVLFLLCLFGTGFVRGELINSEVTKLETAHCNGAVPCVQEPQLADIMDNSGVHTSRQENGSFMAPHTAAGFNPNNPCPTTDLLDSDKVRQLEIQVTGVPHCSQILHHHGNLVIL
jgi:hypothetical protein